MRLLSLIQIPGLTPAPETIDVPKESVSQLKNLSLDELLNKLISGSVQFAINLAIAIIVFYIGKFIINKIHRFIALILIRRKVDPSLSTFILSFVRIVLYFILIVTVIGILGIETSSFLALFASAGVAIGMALSGTLQNFAGGVLLLLLKPYKVGDYIEAQGYAGTVTEIQIFHTIICTPDNKSIIIPNGALSTSSINNYSKQALRRVNWTVGISYGDSVDDARNAIIAMFENDKDILHGEHPDSLISEAAKELAEDEAEAEGSDDKNPVPWYKRIFGGNKKVQEKVSAWRERRAERLKRLQPKVNRDPAVYVDSLADSSVNLTVRAWVKSADYWTVFYRYNERFYNELPKHGINFPFPQLDVHFDKQS